MGMEFDEGHSYKLIQWTELHERDTQGIKLHIEHI